MLKSVLFSLLIWCQEFVPVVGHLGATSILMLVLVVYTLHRSFFAPMTSALAQKIYFFKVLHSLQLSLFFILIGSLTYVSLCTFYRHPIDLVIVEAGFIFFRHDFLVLGFNIVFTLLVCYFLSLVSAQATLWVNEWLPELPILLIALLVSIRLLIAANDLVLIVLTLELLAFCTIILMSSQCGTTTLRLLPLEASVKYFVINALGVTFMLFAVSGFHAVLHHVNLTNLSNYLLLFPGTSVFIVEGFLLCNFFFFLAFLIKLGAAPFHQWVPDVYEGAETLITALLVLIVSPAMMVKFLLVVQLFSTSDAFVSSILQPLFFGCGLLSLLWGTIGAFSQWRIKRFLAFTGITHLGFMLISLSAASTISIVSAFFYLTLYVLMNLVFFSVLILSRLFTKREPLYYITQFALVTNKSFFLTWLLVATLFSFAGLPPFAGFFSKLVILGIVVANFQWWVSGFLLVIIILSAYLYLRFIKTFLFDQTGFTTLTAYVNPRPLDFYQIRVIPSPINCFAPGPARRLLFWNALISIVFVGFIFCLPFAYNVFTQIFFYLELFY